MFRRAQYAPWQIRLFPADFRGDRPCSVVVVGWESLAVEAVRGTGTLIHGSLSLFDFELGQYERSMGTSPAAGQTAQRRLLTRPLNSAAGDGKRHGPRVSFDPSGHGSGGVLFPRCRGHAPAMARGIGRLPRSLDGVLAVPSQRLSTLLSMIDKVFSYSGIPAGPWLATATADPMNRKRHGKRLRFLFAQSCFSCLRGFFIDFSFCSYIFKAIPKARRRTRPLCLAVPPSLTPP